MRIKIKKMLSKQFQCFGFHITFNKREGHSSDVLQAVSDYIDSDKGFSSITDSEWNDADGRFISFSLFGFPNEESARDSADRLKGNIQILI